MKIDKRNIPSLFDALSSKKFVLNFKEKHGEFYDNIRKQVDSIVNYGLENIKLISAPVLEAIDFGDTKTISKLLDLRNEIESCYRLFVFKTPNEPTYQTIFCSFDKQDDKTVFLMFGYIDDRRLSSSVSWLNIGLFNHNDKNNEYGISHDSYIYPDNLNDTHMVNRFCLIQTELMIQMEVFLSYAELETKFLKPYHKDMNGVLCRYENKMPANIEIINSTWYTNLIKSDAFKVRGHFRLQPFGEGLSKRKLVWINEFKKHGYTKEAGRVKAESV